MDKTQSMDIGEQGDSESRHKDFVKALMRDTFDVMIAAEAYSAGAYLFTKDAKFALRYGIWLRELGVQVYVVGFGGACGD